MRSRLRPYAFFFLSLLIFLTPIAVCAVERSAAFTLQQLIDKLFTKKIATRASTGVRIISARTGEVLAERNARALLTPASTVKLISSATLLGTLGLEYAFRTTVSTDDTSHDHQIIRGNLYLQGFGDPYLTSADLKNLAAYLRKQGVNEVRGNVVGDEAFFDHASACAGPDGVEYSTTRFPHLSALTVDLNLMTVTLSPARKKGAKVLVGFPACGSFFKVINQTASVGGGTRYRPSVRAKWTDTSCTIVVSGRMALGSRGRTYTLPVRSPAWYAVSLFTEYLQLEGINISGVTRVGTAPGKLQKLAENRDPIAAVCTSMNKESDNFAAEMVFRTLGAEIGNPPGTVEKGVEAVNSFLDKIGIPQASHRVADGSGMSHQNAVSAEAFVTLLRYMYTRHDLFDTFYNTLPAAGVDGTLRGRMVGTEAEGNLRAKTGTLVGVTSLAGYVTSADNELLIFSITSQDFPRRKSYKSIQDKIGVYLAKWSRERYSGN